MIPVAQMAEYPEFDAQVRQRGQAFLAVTPNPTSEQFSKNNYWKYAVPSLKAAYGGRCAYTSMKVMDGGSVDHYLPKHSHPSLAYEWSNYRYCRSQLNSNKGKSPDVADPFQIPEGFMQLKFPSCLVAAGDGLERPLRVSANMTINVLRLNNENMTTQRFEFAYDFARGLVTLEFLDGFYPFISAEIRRQNLVDGLSAMFDV